MSEWGRFCANTTSENGHFYVGLAIAALCEGEPGSGVSFIVRAGSSPRHPKSLAHKTKRVLDNNGNITYAK